MRNLRMCHVADVKVRESLDCGFACRPFNDSSLMSLRVYKCTYTRYLLRPKLRGLSRDAY